MKVLRATAAAVLLFLCFSTFTAFKPKRGLSLTVKIDGAAATEIFYGENKEKLPAAKKLFGFNYRKYAEKLKKEGLSDCEVLDKMFRGLTADIEKLCAEQKTEAKNAVVDFKPDSKREKFVFTAERGGREIDKNKLYADIVGGLSEKKLTVKAVYKSLKPDITVETLKKNTAKRGSFKTYYGYSAAARQNNIERAVSFINGARIAPSEIFSFNERVGPRTAERGYMEAPIIVDGKFQGGVGGGVCQVSTTLYNAVLYSDLAVKHVNRHSLPVRYVQPSFDAMVSSVSDFRFINNTESDIFIEASCVDGFVVFTLYGAPPEYEIKLVGEKLKSIEAEVQYIDDDTLPEGEENVIAQGANGFTSRGFMLKYRNGELVSNIEIRRDSYAAQKRVVVRGAKKQLEIDGGDMSAL